MKTKLFGNKFVLWFLILIVILQSCTVYNKTPVSLEEAGASNKKAEVLKTNDSILHFKKIEQVNGTFYGVKKVKGQMLKVPLSQNEISRIRTKNESASTTLTIASIVIPLIIGVIILNYSLKDLGEIGSE